MPSADDGPLGKLTGMTFDPIRKRYFPSASKRPAPSILELALDAERHSRREDAKRARMGMVNAEAGPSTPHAVRRNRLPRGRPINEGLLSQRLERLELDAEIEVGMCRHELVSSFISYGESGLYATTDHGNVMLVYGDGTRDRFGICGAKLRGSHRDPMRGVSAVITDGPHAHIHAIRRDLTGVDGMLVFDELDLPHDDTFCISSFDDRFTIGSTKSLVTVTYEEQLRYTLRKLPSDPLAVHQVDHNLVYAGMRNSHIRLDDLRTPSHHKNHLASSLGRKAIVQVQRLKDSAVPFGLVASAMNSELMLFDVRFGKTPLLRYEGHKNTFYKLGLATSPDDRVVIAPGSDCKVRAWSTATGERLGKLSGPTGDHTILDLEDFWDKPIVALHVTPDYGLDIALEGFIRRYRPAESAGRVVEYMLDE